LTTAVALRSRIYVKLGKVGWIISFAVFVDSEAVKWFRRAAVQGFIDAQSSLGAMYIDGRGVPQNHAEAMRWLRLAADQGDVEAQSNLGNMYIKGTGVKRLTRENEEAIIWHKTGNVLLVRVHCPLTFDDFIELERWLAHEEKSAEPGDEEDVGGEILYYREIEKYIIRHGYFEPLLHVEATDEEFLTASFKIKKAGYMAGEPADRVGALTLEALSRYDKNREASLEFFATHERDFQSAKQTPSQIPLSEGEASQDKVEVANLHRHADQGNADAQFFLGLIYETGDGAPQD
jgi:TPR repeat protein